VEASVRRGQRRRGPDPDQANLGGQPRLVDDRRLSTVIAAFRRDVEVTRPLSAALTHIDSELGGRPVGSLDAGDAEALLGRLRDAGLTEHRLAAVSEALRALFAYAVDAELLDRSPLDGRPPGRPTRPEAALRGPERRAQAPPSLAARPPEPPDVRYEPTALPPRLADPPPRAAKPLRTPTEAVLAVAVGAAKWTERLILLAFVVVVIALALELG
jgi:hypothetical protein